MIERHMRPEGPTWFRDLHSDRRRQAYIATNGEPAWPALAALQVIQELTDRSCRVIGIEVWLPTQPGPTVAGPPYYWEPPREIYGSLTDIRSTNAEAQEYIRGFKLDPADTKSVGHELHFNLEVDCGSEPRK